METENKDWKPEVGKTAWQLIGKTLRHVEIYGIGAMEPSNPNLAAFLRNAQGNLGATSMSAVGDYLFPTAEAALASIKIYDLEGKEVVIPRAIHFSGICSECSSSIALDAKQTNAMEKLAEAAYNMQFGGGAAIGGKSDQREGGC